MFVECVNKGEKSIFYMIVGDCGEKRGIAYMLLLISQGGEDKTRLLTKSTLKVATPLASHVNAYSLVLSLVRRAGSGLEY